MRELHTGDTLAGYRIDALCGRGGMGVVYRATHLILKRVDAVKVIAPELAEQLEFRHRFERESRVAAQIDHPNVIPIYAAGEEEGLLYIAMRFVEGTDLRAVLRRDGRIAPMHAAQIAAAIGDALDAAHERGLVHRDVKPANVLITHQRGREHVYLSDFGLAKVTTSPEGETRTGMFVGTTDYVSPEQVLGARLDARSDVYSLGCTLFHMLVGQVPYPLEADAAKLIAHTRDPMPSVLAIAPDIPPQFEAVIARATAKQPEDRYLSAGDLGRAALAAAEGRILVDGQRSVARGQAAPTEVATEARTSSETPDAALLATAPTVPQREGVQTTLQAPVAEESARDAVATEPASPERATSRRRWAWVGGAAVVVVAGIAAAVVALATGSAHHTAANKGPSGLPHVTAGPPFTKGAVTVGNSPDGIVNANGEVWIANAGDGTVTRIDQISANVEGTVRFANHSVMASPMANWKDAIWVADAAAGTLTRINAFTGNVVGRPIRIGGHPSAMVAADGDIWIANPENDTVTRIDAANGMRIGTPIPVGNDPRRMAVDNQTVLVANGGAGTVTEINAGSGQVTGTIKVGDHPDGINSAAGAIWVANPDNNAVTRINAASGTPVGTPIRVGMDPRRVVANQVRVWVANAGDGTVTRIDAATGRILGTIRVGGHPDVMTIVGNTVWVASWSQPNVAPKGVPGTVTRIEESSGKVLAASARH